MNLNEAQAKGFNFYEKLHQALAPLMTIPVTSAPKADELFWWLRSIFLVRKYGTVLPLNRREVLNYNVQIGSFSELEFCRQYGADTKLVHLAFNSLYYRPEQYEEITQIIQQCRSIGFDSYILADPALLVYLRKERSTVRCI